MTKRYKCRRKVIEFLFSTIICCSMLICVAIHFMGIIDLSRIFDPIEEVVLFISGRYEARSNGYISYFFSDSKALYVPKGLELLWGGGYQKNVSDVGYIMNLWRGGIVFSVCLYTFYILLILDWKKKKNTTNDGYIKWIIVVTMFLSNIKGDAFLSLNEFLSLFFLLIGISELAPKSYCRNEDIDEYSGINNSSYI